MVLDNSSFAAVLQDFRAGRMEAAEESCRRIIAATPNHADAWHLWGLIVGERGERQQAVDYLQRAWQLNPRNLATLNNLGIMLKNLGQHDQAAECYSEVLRQDPNFVAAYNNLANVRLEQKQFESALECCRRAIEIRADFVDAQVTLGSVLREMGRLDEAAEANWRVLNEYPRHAAVLNNLGLVLKDQGDLDGAIDCHRQASELNPQNVAYQGNLAYAMYFHPDCDARAIYEEHVRWNDNHAARLYRPQEYPNERRIDRRLRIGYVSPDFRSHSVGGFITPLLEAHDHRAVEVYCYSSVRRPDGLTARCRVAADTWRNVAGLSDDQLVELIRRDQIDILVDLTMHMAENRLLVFARKPAPVQVTYLAYCGTTGLETIDYRLSDPYLDPPGRDDSYYSEKTWRLPETYWCYRPFSNSPALTTVPETKRGFTTFGCLNNFCKVNRKTLDAWGRLLAETPQSRLMIHAQPGSHRLRVEEIFAGFNVSADRLTWVGWLHTNQYLQAYQEIDICLDPFPYGGGTTTCDALWMGVPVVSLAGNTAVGRGGVSLLSNLDLPELVAGSVDQYIEIARDLAESPERLIELRESLRSKMQRSVIMDEPRFARHFEAAYREMWRRWCEPIARRSIQEMDQAPNACDS